ncbi:MAG: hypothetical protein K6G22_12885 [Lachnospiraceae bacterium]|nr:hypothetical protein [Lachnospiraceae bacterium]
MNIENREMTLEELMKTKGVEVKEKRGGHFYYIIHMTQKMHDTDIEALDLSVRSFHSLKRAGLDTIGKLAESISSGKELKHIKNCGTKSVREIMEHLFLFQYMSMRPDKRDEFLVETTILNEARK